MARRTPDLAELRDGVIAGDRATLARAITLVESRREDHRTIARALVAALLPRTGRAHRIGVSGVPGVGKSTFLEAVGLARIAAGRRVAVLAVDPSSGVSGGSILGDKTRMPTLATHPSAYVRPSPTSGALGGVHRATQQAMVLCEAAGFDLIFVETVGVGQSETQVAEMVDTYLVLLLAGAGDELQGIKRGILELADVLAIHKADGDGEARAEAARRELQGALRLLRGPDAPPVFACSSVTGAGHEALWAAITARFDAEVASGRLAARRAEQGVRWLRRLVDEEVLRRFWADPAVLARLAAAEVAVREGALTAGAAADQVLGAR
jgi:LAO/AO transport system kinase